MRLYFAGSGAYSHNQPSWSWLSSIQICLSFVVIFSGPKYGLPWNDFMVIELSLVLCELSRSRRSLLGFPVGSVVKNPPVNVRDTGLIPGWFSGGGNGNPLQYSCLGNRTDCRAWWVIDHGVTKSQLQLNAHAKILITGLLKFLMT